MKRLLNILGAVVITFILSSCEEIIEFDSSSGQQKIVLHGFISPDSLFKIHLSRSNLITGFQHEFITVEDRIIQVYEDQHLIKSLNHRQGGYYYEQGFYPKPGKSYEVEVIFNGQTEVTATTYLPEPVMIEKLDTSSLFVDGAHFMHLKLVMHDPLYRNYYIISIKEDSLFKVEGGKVYPINKKVNPYRFFEIAESGEIAEKELEINWGISYQQEKPDCFFSDEIFSGNEAMIEMVTDHFSNNIVHSLLTIHLQNISEDYFLYQASKTNYINSKENPFAEPVRVYSNVVNGMGIFAGASTSKSAIDYYNELLGKSIKNSDPILH